MATRVRALIQPVDPWPARLLLSDPRVAADLVNYYCYPKQIKRSFETSNKIPSYIYKIYSHFGWRIDVSLLLDDAYATAYFLFSSTVYNESNWANTCRRNGD